MEICAAVFFAKKVDDRDDRLYLQYLALLNCFPAWIWVACLHAVGHGWFQLQLVSFEEPDRTQQRAGGGQGIPPKAN